LRAELGFAPQDYVIGLCSSLRPGKAHGDLLHALGATALARRCREGRSSLATAPSAPRSRTPLATSTARTRGHHGTSGGRRPFIGCCDVMTLVSHAIETSRCLPWNSMALANPWS